MGFSQISKILVIATFLAGCAGGNQVNFSEEVTSSPDRATLVFKRGTELTYALAAARIKVNGTSVGKLSRGKSIVEPVSSGKVNVEVTMALNPGSSGLTLNVENGKVYNFNISPRGGVLSNSFGALGVLVSGQEKGQNGPFQLQLIDVK